VIIKDRIRVAWVYEYCNGFILIKTFYALAAASVNYEFRIYTYLSQAKKHFDCMLKNCRLINRNWCRL